MKKVNLKTKCLVNNIYLVGFMGTGKSAVGRLVAQKNKLQFNAVFIFIFFH